ncbi:Ankyrin repeat - like 10 [Theobroma cacao]|nr:Ankyrin repeat - like 10 [Theobroma cacao]
MVNMEQDTALHDAARNGHYQIAELLIKEAPELALLTNNVGESPLFIAVDKKHVDVAKLILEVAPDCSFGDFIEFLTGKCQSALSETDEYGWTPLHYAVHFGAVDIFQLFLIDSSTAYIRDNEGMSVIHIAAREGEVVILEMLAYRFPEIWDLQDNNGQTALHLAVAKGKLDSVKFILDFVLSHDGLINQQDNEGNTALHLATIQRHNHKIFELLMKDSRVDKTATNMEGLTVIDILLLNKEFGYYEKLPDRLMEMKEISTAC